MKLSEVKELVNLKTISEVAEVTGFEGFFEEELEILITEMNDRVYKAGRNNELDDESIKYMDKLREIVRKEIMNTLKTLKYKNLEG